MGVRDIGALSGGSWGPWISPLDNDCGWSLRECVASLLSGCCGTECGASWKQSLDRIIVGDGARVGLGCVGVHNKNACQSDRMRGNRLGVGDVGEMLAGSGVGKDSTGDDDGGRSRWELE